MSHDHAREFSQAYGFDCSNSNSAERSTDSFPVNGNSTIQSDNFAPHSGQQGQQQDCNIYDSYFQRDPSFEPLSDSVPCEKNQCQREYSSFVPPLTQPKTRATTQTPPPCSVVSIDEKYIEVQQEVLDAKENLAKYLQNHEKALKAVEEANRLYTLAQFQVEEADVRLHEANYNRSEIQLKLPGQWNNMYNHLLEYKERNNHCNVSQDKVSIRTKKRDFQSKEEQDSIALARWVGNQRVYYKKHKSGFKTKLNQHRIDALERLGFIWDLKGAKWQNRLDQLVQFKKKTGHYRVPTGYSTELSKWVIAQRYLWRRKKEGKDLPHLTLEREELLQEIDFKFEE